MNAPKSPKVFSRLTCPLFLSNFARSISTTPNARTLEIGCGLRVHLFGRYIGCDEVPTAALLLCDGEGVAPFPGFFARFTEGFFGPFGLGSNRHEGCGLGFVAEGDR
jgi:hypothetical protein